MVHMHPGSTENAIPAFPPLSAAHTPEPARTGAARGPYRKSRHTRDAILAAAMDVFSTHGYRASSLREIGRLAGIDQSSIMHHFPTKSALLLAVMQERDRQADEIVLAQHPETLEELPAAALALARHNAETPGVIELYTMLAAESLSPDHPLGDYFRERVHRVRLGFSQWFQRLEQAGMLRDGVTEDFAADSFFALWEGLQLHWLLDPGRGEVTATLENFLRLIRRDDAPDPAADPAHEHPAPEST